MKGTKEGSNGAVKLGGHVNDCGGVVSENPGGTLPLPQLHAHLRQTDRQTDTESGVLVEQEKGDEGGHLYFYKMKDWRLLRGHLPLFGERCHAQLGREWGNGLR